MGSLYKEDVSYRYIDENDIELIENNNTLLKEFEIPILYQKENPNARIFFILADGTENDLSNPNKLTNIGKLYYELLKISKKNPHIKFAYKEGVGTQDKESIYNAFKAKLDAISSFSFKDRAEFLYEMFSKQATAWKRENKDAEISVVQVGFSRGCGIAVYLNQMIHEKGILDTNSRAKVNNKWKNTGKKLIEPGVIKQAIVLYDPVLTSMKYNDFSLKKNIFKLSDSTVSALQINANNEYRVLFPVSNFIKDGLSSNKNFLNIAYPGAHSDIGGSYTPDGIGRLTRFIVNNYLNGVLGGKDFFEKVKLLKNKKEYVIHNSEEHSVIYFTQDLRGVKCEINHLLDDRINNLPICKLDYMEIDISIFKQDFLESNPIDILDEWSIIDIDGRDITKTKEKKETIKSNQELLDRDLSPEERAKKQKEFNEKLKKIKEDSKDKEIQKSNSRGINL